MAHQQQPAVVIIARHGARLDAADQNWHLSTPTPYDPPLTYAGWNQCRALGLRIASLLHAREQLINESILTDQDGASEDGSANGNGSRKRKRKHKVVIHSSPFLRCLQTSVAISAGMAQYQPNATSTPSMGKSRTPSSMHSASPRLRASQGPGASSSPHLMPIAEPKHDLAHEIARKVLSEQPKRHRRSKMRVDAFLGEWLNPQYFDQITPPPPSAMMVATAKAEMMQNESIDVYTPTVSAGSPTGMWGSATPRNVSRESTLEDWSHVRDALPAQSARRDRASSVNSAGSNDSGSGRRSPFRPGHVLHPSTSTLKLDTTAYVPPTPSYAVSGSDHIPRGYVAHARNATVNMDYQWDSSRQPQAWGDGGEYGEEWSSMHKRFRRGINSLTHWYSQHSADDRAEDALGFDQAEHHEEEEESDEQEDLVVILITHGAGCNALIGAITGQPVLLDVGMASLTMAVRRDDAPASSPVDSGTDTSYSTQLKDDSQRKPSLDMGLSAIYEMKLVASSEHLRPGSDPLRSASSPFSSAQPRVPSKNLSARRGDSAHSAAGSPINAAWNLREDQFNEKTRSQSASLGSMRRPHPSTAAPTVGPTSIAAPTPLSASGGLHRSSTLPSSGTDHESLPALSGSTTPTSWGGGGLWTPPAARTPLLNAQAAKDERRSFFSTLNGSNTRDANADVRSPEDEMVLDFSLSPPDSRPSSSGGPKDKSITLSLDGHVSPKQRLNESSAAPQTSLPPPAASSANGAPLSAIASAESEHDALPDLPQVGEKVPSSLQRGLSQKGLWGARPSGEFVKRGLGTGPKRRWTMEVGNGE